MLRDVGLTASLILLLTLSPVVHAATGPAADNTFRRGWLLLSEERFAEARETFEGISPGAYDLGDYVLYFTGVALSREKKPEEAASALAQLLFSFPASPLVPYMRHEMAFAAAKRDDIASARIYFRESRGKVSGSERKAAEGYIAARLMEEAEEEREQPEGNRKEDGEETQKEGKKRAAEAHLENFATYTVQEGALLSMDRLWKWREGGELSAWDLSVSFYGKYAKALFRAGEEKRARAVFREALETFSPSDEYYEVLLDYGEFLRKQGEISGARSLLRNAAKDAPASFRSEVDYLFARVEWKAGRNAEARRMFLEIAESGALPLTAERARYQAAWIAVEEEDWKTATEQFDKLRTARDGRIRQESVFRHAFGLYRQMRYGEAIAAFEEGEHGATSPVERARHAYWRARAYAETGEEQKSDVLLRTIAADPGAGPYAIFANQRLGRDPFGMLNAPASGETVYCDAGRERLWQKVRDAPWSREDAESVRRTERLIHLGLVEYAILEADRVDRTAVRRVTGISGGGTQALFRYLAGDLRGAIAESGGLAHGSPDTGLVDRLQYPLAPEFLGDCDGKKSGVDILVIHAIIRQESLFQYNALSPAGAVGLMQLMPRTASEVARKEKMGKTLRRSDLLRPDLNVTLGAAYLSSLLAGYDGDYVRAVAAYNAGESAVARWWGKSREDPSMFLETVTYQETRSYLRRVFFNLLQYYRIYRPGMLARYFPSDRTGDGTAPGAPASPPDAETPGDRGDGSPQGEDASPGGEAGE